MTVTALTGPLFLLPINSLISISVLGGLGMYGRGLSGRAEWVVPVGLVAGILSGLAAGSVGLQIPHTAIVLAALVLGTGLLVALMPRIPETVAMAGAVLLGALGGLSAIVPTPGGLVGWVGLATGMTVAVAAGVGLAAILAQAFSWQIVRGIGLVITAYGGFLLFVIT